MGKKKTPKFDNTDLPAQVVVFLEQDGDDPPYTVSQQEIAGLDDGTVVGIYELVRVARVTVGTTLEDI